MHTRTIDLARTAACWQESTATDPLDAARGVLTGIAISAVCWLLAFALVALVFDGAAVVAAVLL